MTPKRVEPRVCMRVVAVEKGTVDVEEDRSDTRHGDANAVDVPQASRAGETRDGTGFAFPNDMNAIDLLKEQHKKTKVALEKASKGKLDAVEAKKAADELVAHMVIEEHIFYPRIRELMKDMVGESFEEHTVARFALARALTARGDQEVKARFTVLKELIGHHVEEEESEMFPKVQKGVDASELDRLGTRMLALFEKAATMGLEAIVVGQEQALRVSGTNGSSSAKERPSRQMRSAR